MQKIFWKDLILHEQGGVKSSKMLLLFEVPVLIPIETTVDLRIEVSSSKVYSSKQKSFSSDIDSSLQALAREKVTWSVIKMIEENVTEDAARKIEAFFKNSRDELFPLVDKDWYLIWGVVPTESPIRFSVTLLASVEIVPNLAEKEIIILRFANEFVDIFENLLRREKFEELVLNSHELNVLKRKLSLGSQFSFKSFQSLLTYLNELSTKLSKEIDELPSKLNDLDALLKDKENELSELNALLKDKEKPASEIVKKGASAEEIKQKIGEIKAKIQKIEKEISSLKFEKEKVEKEIKEKIGIRATINGFLNSIRDKRYQIYREYSLDEKDREEIKRFVADLLLGKANYRSSFVKLRNYLIDAFNDFVFQVLIYENISVLHVKSLEIIGTHILGNIMKSGLDSKVQKYINEKKITEDKVARFLFYMLFIHSLIKNKLVNRLSGSEFTITLEELLRVLETEEMASEILITSASAAEQGDTNIQPMSEASWDYVDKLEKAAALLLSYYSEEKLLKESTEETVSDSGQTKKPTWSSLSDAISRTNFILSRMAAKFAGEIGVTIGGQGSKVGNLQTGDTGKQASSEAPKGGELQPETKAEGKSKIKKVEGETGEGGGKSKGKSMSKQGVEKIDTEEIAAEFEEEETAAQINPSEIDVDKTVPAECEQIIYHFRDKINKIIEGSNRVEGEKVGFHLSFDDYPVVITIDEMMRHSFKKLRPFPIVKGSIYISVPALQKVTRAFIPSEVDNLVRAYLWRKEVESSADVGKPIVVQFSYTLKPLVAKASFGLSFYYDIEIDFGKDLEEKMSKETGWQIILKKEGEAKFEMEIKSFKEKEEMLRGLFPWQRRAFFFRISDDSTYIVSFYKTPSFIVTRDYAQAFHDLLNKFIEEIVDEDSFLRASAYSLISKVRKYIERLKSEKYSSVGSKNTGSDRWLIISDDNQMMAIYAIASLIESGKLKLETDNEELKKEYELLRDEFEEISKYLKFMVIPGGSYRFDEGKVKTAALASLKFVNKQLNAASKWLLNTLSSCLLKYINSMIKGVN